MEGGREGKGGGGGGGGGGARRGSEDGEGAGEGILHAQTPRCCTPKLDCSERNFFSEHGWDGAVGLFVHEAAQILSCWLCSSTQKSQHLSPGKAPAFSALTLSVQHRRFPDRTTRL